jgi:acetyl-CoA carboxylase biotin carboxyl carrier protein
MARKGKGGGAPRAAAVVDADGPFDVEALRQIVEILETSDVSRMVWRSGNQRLVIRRDSAVAPVVVHAAPASSGVVVSAPAPQAPPAAPPAPKPAEGQLVTSPFVGTFYRSPSPDQASFVEVGSAIKKGQVLCIVEAMKLMNEIESEFSGKVAEILVQNGQPVEFGQTLFRILPA